MKILFVHNNFPGQFKFLAPALVHEGHEVVALTARRHPGPTWQGVKLVHYQPARRNSPHTHPWLQDFEVKTLRAEACFQVARRLKAAGFTPDVIVAHPGWGESLFLKDVWPGARLGLYCEYFYRAVGGDADFDPEFASATDTLTPRLRLKNLNNLAHLDCADAGLSPTRWQADTFPRPFRDRITVAHDGIDTDLVTPRPDASLTLGLREGGQLTLTRDSEVITYVTRNLEPYRGYHCFMRALPALLKRRPHAHVLLVGGDGVSYGARPPGAQSWKDIFINEVRPAISDTDWARVRFLGHIPYPDFLTLLQLSRVHVYLTYPFVLSWSLIEAMSAGCAIVASDTAPVREVLTHGHTGHTVDFFDTAALTDTVCALLDHPAERTRLGQNARQFARAEYDLKTRCLPQQMAWVHGLMG